MRTEEPRAVHLADYQAPEFRIHTVHLDFALEPEATRVASKLAIERQSGSGPLVLHGENQKLISVALDGRALPQAHSGYNKCTRTFANAPDRTRSNRLSIRCSAHPLESQAIAGGGGHFRIAGAEREHRTAFGADDPSGF